MGQEYVYVINDENTLNKITELMKDKVILIADGHHRYETSIAYRDFRNGSNPDDNAEYNWIMCYYTNLDDENLKVFPTHRIVTKAVDTGKLLNDLKKYFDSKEYALIKTLSKL